MDVSLLEEMDFDNVNIDWEFSETILKELPSNIYFKDTQCRYLFCTHYWNHIVHDDTEAWSIRGKTDMEIRSGGQNVQKTLLSLLLYEIVMKGGAGLSSYEVSENYC